ncbi:cathelicidin antimicrobial peptide-like [Nannospalax galili]|uniref:cathelicidin antimicrobial peptide-like n=1 Tax=Nannospalax galili TaxID=1026970 RepID=UPI0004ED4DE8|nr:cathelicidin antimicrobial peptide-like [Nannospalax galili]
MQTQKDGPCLGRWLLLLMLDLVMPLAISKTLSTREAVLRAVDDFNQRSLDTNLYRLLDLDSQSSGDEDPDTPKHVRFTVKETVCHKASKQLLEQCDFKEHGLVKQCMGTVTLDEATGSFDVSCNGPQRFKKVSQLTGLLRKGGLKIGEKIQKIGQKIQDFFQKFIPETGE